MNDLAALPLLAVEDLTKRFGARPALDAVSFELWPGEVLAIVGESGSGKTTLLNAIAGRVTPDAGRVIYRSADGGTADLVALSEAERRRLLRTDLGLVHQKPARRAAAVGSAPAPTSASA